ncbi:MAG: alkaline phosphatase family protein, partial [Janthinobacterium lividum]
TEGTYADGVHGVFPTVTYPSHTTLVTGVLPAEHGIYNNQIFDPEHHFDGAWYWYSDQVKVPTLWSAAHTAGLRTASVSWPVTVDSNVIDDNLPEYWRGALSVEAGNPQDRNLMNAVSRPDGALAEMQRRLGPYTMGTEVTLAGDRTRTIFAADIITRKHPDLMTVHLSSLDEEEHLHAPFSPEANADLEGLDTCLGQLITAAKAANPATTVVVVSDHGFAPIHDAVNLYLPFLQAGLIRVGKPAPGSTLPTITAWTAEPWMASGMAAVMLHDPNDTTTRQQVKTMLDKLAADPASGIDRILTGAEAEQKGAFPGAAFVVLLRVGFYTGSAFTGPLLTPTSGHGTHGYSPDAPEMQSSFFALGPGIAHGRDLGKIDIREIAPTLAMVLGITLPSAKGKPLAIFSQ